MPASTAVYSLILTDVKAIVRASISTLEIVVRKALILTEADLAVLPVCILIPSDRANANEGFEGAIIREYEVGVAVVYSDNQELDTTLYKDAAIRARATLEKALHVTSLPNAPTVYDCDLDPNPIYNADALPKDVDWSVFKLTYKSSEQRNT